MSKAKLPFTIGQRMRCILFITVLTALWLGAPAAWGDMADVMPSSGLFSDVISRSQKPHVYDWRKASSELDLGYGYTDEANNFDNEAYDIGLGFPLGSGIFRLDLRRINVYPTRSSNLLGRTPFTQEATVTRYEAGGTFMWSVFEGRSISRLSPAVTDLDHAFFLTAGLFYSHPNKSLMIKKSDTPAPLLGQQQVTPTLVSEIGMRWHLYLPQAFGLFFAYTKQFANKGHDLNSWISVSGGLLWSFGAH